MLTTISNSIIPLVIFAVVLYGCIKKTNVYEDFIDGAFDGMKIVVELVPTLIVNYLLLQNNMKYKPTLL